MIEKRLKYIMIRVTDEEKKEFQERANKERISISEYIRKKCLKNRR